MKVVRLCKRDYDTLDGDGASKTGGRWTSPGLHVTYTASCGALAILEYTAHMAKLPTNMILLAIEIPDTLPIEIGRRETRSHFVRLETNGSRALQPPCFKFPRSLRQAKRII